MEKEELKKEYEELHKKLHGDDTPIKTPGRAGADWYSKMIKQLKEQLPENETIETVTPPEVLETAKKTKASKNTFVWKGEEYDYKKGKNYAIIYNDRVCYHFNLTQIRMIVSQTKIPFEIPEGQIYPENINSKCKTCGK